MLRQYKDTASVYRQVKKDGKTFFEKTEIKVTGYLHPLSPEKNQISPDKFGKEFAFTTPVDADIQEVDELEIAGERYRVKGVAKNTGIIVKFKRILIVKTEKGKS